jgi:PAS domain S-box-containing protein
MSNLPGMAYRCKHDKDFTLEFASDGCSELTGYKPADFAEKRIISFAELIHHDDRDKVWDDVQSAVREKRSFQLTYRITTATGNEKWVWEQGNGVFSSDGTLEALEGFICDITARKRAEEEIRKLNAELERRVAERTAELRKLVNAMAGREVRMAELKEVIRQLQAQLKDAGMTPVAGDPLDTK